MTILNDESVAGKHKRYTNVWKKVKAEHEALILSLVSTSTLFYRHSLWTRLLLLQTLYVCLSVCLCLSVSLWRLIARKLMNRF